MVTKGGAGTGAGTVRTAEPTGASTGAGTAASALRSAPPPTVIEKNARSCIFSDRTSAVRLSALPANGLLEEARGRARERPS